MSYPFVSLALVTASQKAPVLNLGNFILPSSKNC